MCRNAARISRNDVRIRENILTKTKRATPAKFPRQPLQWPCILGLHFFPFVISSTDRRGICFIKLIAYILFVKPAFDKNDYRHIKKGFAKILGNVNGFANKQLGVVKMTSCKEPPYYVNCDGFLHESNQHTNQGHEYSSTNKRLIFLPYLQLITFHYQTWVWSLPTNSLTISLWKRHFFNSML